MLGLNVVRGNVVLRKSSSGKGLLGRFWGKVIQGIAVVPKNYHNAISAIQYNVQIYH
jgi:hypothetical protein